MHLHSEKHAQQTADPEALLGSEALPEAGALSASEGPTEMEGAQLAAQKRKTGPRSKAEESNSGSETKSRSKTSRQAGRRLKQLQEDDSENVPPGSGSGQYEAK